MGAATINRKDLNEFKSIDLEPLMLSFIATTATSFMMSLLPSSYTSELLFIAALSLAATFGLLCLAGSIEAPRARSAPSSNGVSHG